MRKFFLLPIFVGLPVILESPLFVARFQVSSQNSFCIFNKFSSIPTIGYNLHQPMKPEFQFREKRREHLCYHVYWPHEQQQP